MELNKCSSLALIISLYFLSIPFVAPQITSSTNDRSPGTTTNPIVNPSRGRAPTSDDGPNPKTRPTRPPTIPAKNNSTSNPKPTPTTSLVEKPSPTACSIINIKLEVCLDLVGGLLNPNGDTPKEDDLCCPLIQGLLGLEVSVCICNLLKSNSLSDALHLNSLLKLFLRLCGLQPSLDFQCV
ncbi:hypothetical protein vseg_006381 [Gypsophila vaccaria]